MIPPPPRSTLFPYTTLFRSGYTHGLNMVIENVRQLRHDADDSCPIGPDGKRQHTYDYREGGCRQVRKCELDRKSTRLNSSHPSISYAVFCLKKKIDTSSQAS